MAKTNSRSIQDINNAYFRKVAELGDLEWKLSKIPLQIDLVKREIRQIDNEMDQAQALKAKEDQKIALAARDAAKKQQQDQPGESA